ncbi:hypothetical protein BOX15_Mlig016391g2 [Macrostomum lignano]|uniref:Uncharacterized protein n=2 Tax=Macrostomum lignano TaxID=282301 RepID=A0A267DJB6_9PLAT|nr:hypothetical protein BOX15_Mlig016391g3 [Macrostomum lignano]PAA53302.1 hypothetical protein BOX15_Mlig016391g2 [Macrostomum lignano]
MPNRSSPICLGFLLFAALAGAGQAIHCLVYHYSSGITGGISRAMVVECGSSVTSCHKDQITATTPGSNLEFKNNLTLTSYSGSCGECQGRSFPGTTYICTACKTDQCNSAFADMRPWLRLTLALPVLIVAALCNF